ncbi:MAG: protein translocase subunit SecD [Gammaproteobacteria bacterium]|nr:protein translocase subunit SecD [Gammaproteobacteria bacterium]MBT5686768.1 protein translocase subunit SecD [Gammaproteobacteria bacterium]MBT5725387.1 protein translocase subunit SecD [Gammaproteobacteria bacterium]MBT6586908.1 protein translocase subunit SecD [Gammaproteobacteria bacterium]MBT7877571.1 protein translocase subunit SecD [Gammaproteobacteria bacterium]
MINRYPLWKNLLVLAVVSLGVVYALPNIYPPDFAVQISTESADGTFTEQALNAATARLEEDSVEYFGPEMQENGGLIRFHNDESQLRARDLIQLALHDLPDEYVVALNAAPTTPQWLVDIGGEPMKYGLDLRGGVHFLMEVDTVSAVGERIEGLEQDIKRTFRDKDDRIRYSGFSSPVSGVLQIAFSDEETRDRGERKLKDRYPQYLIVASPAAPELTLTVDEASIREMEDFAVQQNLQAIRNRVNELGVAEPLVQRLGRDRIVVDLPGVQDTARAKNILGKVATLEFRMEALPDATRSSTQKFDYEGYSADIEKDIILRGDRVLDANVGFDPDSGLPQVNIRLDGDGGELMHRSTRHNVGRRMAVIFIETKTRDRKVIEDGIEVLKPEPYVVRRVVSLATVQSALGVNFRITGLQAGEARELSLLLRAGALAADMFIAEERTVGASLGAENIKLGAISISVGLGLVVLFMLVYYKSFGLAATLALTANMVLLVAVMSSLSATLTLPGIAGIVLTVGMAVDANVLIFSRIKEELKKGMPPQQAINAGFERAFVTILDANLTTLIVAVILYSIGTGPVKGFAVTLSIGILTSMFTAIMGTRAIVNLMYGGRKVERLAI